MRTNRIPSRALAEPKIERRRLYLALTAVLALATLAGCATPLRPGAHAQPNGGTAGPTVTITEDVTVRATVPPEAPATAPNVGYQDSASASGAEWALAAQSHSERAGQVIVTGITASAQDSFDRVVFELDGAGLPGWDIQYVPAAIQDGSGFPVSLAGAQILQVRITNAAFPPDAAATEFAGNQPVILAGRAVQEVVYTNWFEGAATAFIGVNGDSERAFRAYAVESPAQLVVDIEH